MLAAFAAMIGAPAQAACAFQMIAVLPVTMYGLSPQTTAKINGRETRFIVDSGAFFGVISPGTAAENGLKLQAAPQGFYMEGVGGSVDLNVVTVKTFTLAGVDLPNRQFLVGGSEVGSAGVIGQNILHLGDVEYDLPHGAVRLFRPAGCGDKILAYWAGSSPLSELPLEESQSRLSHTRATILINGQKIVALFDTGAETSMLSLSAAARLGMKPGSPGMKPSGMTGGFGKHMVQTWIAPFATVELAGEQLRNVRIAVGDLGQLDADMLVGADFFLAHRVYVANSQRKMWFTYTGGTFFNAMDEKVRAVDAKGQPLALKDTAGDPTDAEGYSRRGMALAAKAQREAALADLDRAVELAPKEPRYLLQRGSIQRLLEHPALAEVDVDRALALKPDDADALIARAELRLGAHEPERARQDMEAASRLLDKASDARFELAELFGAVERRRQAIAELDLWIAAHPADSRRSTALNDRCWARALLGQELDKALGDCTAAIRTMPRKQMGLDSRGLVNLRLGNAAAAVKDYDAALAIEPGMAWSLYGRGLAKLKLGEREAGEQDLAAADKIDPKLRERARGYGVAP